MFTDRSNQHGLNFSNFKLAMGRPLDNSFKNQLFLETKALIMENTRKGNELMLNNVKYKWNPPDGIRFLDVKFYVDYFYRYSKFFDFISS